MRRQAVPSNASASGACSPSRFTRRGFSTLSCWPECWRRIPANEDPAELINELPLTAVARRGRQQSHAPATSCEPRDNWRRSGRRTGCVESEPYADRCHLSGAAQPNRDRRSASRNPSCSGWREPDDRVADGVSPPLGRSGSGPPGDAGARVIALTAADYGVAWDDWVQTRVRRAGARLFRVRRKGPGRQQVSGPAVLCSGV